ncbi:hypothetical protein Nepgr_030031 [Nepenthes gracilis]|uniref:Uncharacterized protein n=1 Tax=Nepenthes gracilis TaxID=150966 RepID=A0AAD3TDQ7_NEPGR|nr:hypothetical protein Nepgr_030031 [Nepenthes gracilis]
MKPKINVEARRGKTKTIERVGPNWALVAGGALLSTLSIHLGYKLKQSLAAKQPDNAAVKGWRQDARYAFKVDWTMCCRICDSLKEIHNKRGAEGMRMAAINPSNGQTYAEPNMALPLVAVSVPEYNRENSMFWASSPEHLEQPAKPFHRSNCSSSPCVSESGSDTFSKREVIQKLRQQLRRRDDIILEMQDQVMELQNALSTQVSHSKHLQLQLDAANRELLDSGMEVLKLRKTIVDRCVERTEAHEKCMPPPEWHANGHLVDEEINLEMPEKSRETLKREIKELKEVIQGKEYLVQSYKEQKTELSLKIKELQQRLDFQLPNIL